MKKKDDPKVYEITDFEWLKLGAYRHHICCGCGMEHKVEYRVHEGQIEERWITTKKPRQRRRGAVPKA